MFEQRITDYPPQTLSLTVTDNQTEKETRDEAIYYAEKLTAYQVPIQLHDGLILYLTRRIRPGSFLCAVIRNDLKEACKRADEACGPNLTRIVGFLFNHAPIGSWGSEEALETWLTPAHHLTEQP